MPEASAAGVLGAGVGRERRARHRVELARDAVDAHVVGAVGAHLELEHVVAERHVAPRLLAHFERVGKDHDPLAVGAELDLGLGEDHPVRLDPAQLCATELLAVGHHRPRKGHEHGLPRRDIRCAADDRAHVRAGELHRADGQAVRIRVRIRAHHLADPEEARVAVARRHSDTRDPLELGPAERQPIADLLGREAGIAVLREPGDGNFQNCSRKRRSFSKKRRRSGTPCLSIAIRSTPMPNAKPWTRSES